MSELPLDLIPLPTAPYSERPTSLPLDVEECRTAIWLVRGNITEAAKLIKVTPLRLRTFVNKSPYLSAEMQEAKDQLVDVAEAVVYEALTDEEDKSRKDTMARYVLSAQGKHRGWGTSSAGLKINNNAGGTIIVSWQDGQTFGEESSVRNDTTQGDVVDIEPDAAA